MARTISDEEIQLKRRARRRLIGAIVLVTLIVVVLPIVLDSEPKPVGRDVAVLIPSPDSAGPATKLAPLPAPKEAGTAPVGEAPAPARPAAQPEKAKSAKTAPPKKEPARTRAKPKPKPAKPAIPPAEGQFVVQVSALADADRARQMQQQIAAAGVKSYTEIVRTAKGDVTRVRAGPFATREAAERAREQLKSLGMSGNVTSK
jgi:DedD protein